MGKSVATVRRLEGTELHPEIDEDGVHWFDEEEVEELAKRGAVSSTSQYARGQPRRESPDPSLRTTDRAAIRSVAASAAIERDQSRRDLAEAERRASFAERQLREAQHRAEELANEQRTLRALVQTFASLLLEACDEKMLQRFDGELVATIRACARLRD